MSNQLSFEQRIAELRMAAKVIADEADRMQAANERFVQKKTQRTTASK